MSGHLSIGGIEFEILPVPGKFVEAILSDSLMLRGIWRDVYAWDAARQVGKTLVPVTTSGATPLPNGIVFYVPRVLPSGQIALNEAASTRMADRMLALVDSGSITDLTRAVTEVVQQPQKKLPLDAFEMLNKVVSYKLRMHLSFAVVQLRHRAEDLSAYLCLPSRVAFHAEITSVFDDEGYQRLIAQDRSIRHLSAEFAVPSKSAANRGIRRVALRRRIEELRDAIANSGPIRDAEAGMAMDRLRDDLNRADEEWEALAS